MDGSRRGNWGDFPHCSEHVVRLSPNDQVPVIYYTGRCSIEARVGDAGELVLFVACDLDGVLLPLLEILDLSLLPGELPLEPQRGLGQRWRRPDTQFATGGWEERVVSRPRLHRRCRGPTASRLWKVVLQGLVNTGLDLGPPAEVERRDSGHRSRTAGLQVFLVPFDRDPLPPLRSPPGRSYCSRRSIRSRDGLSMDGGKPAGAFPPARSR